MKPIIFLIFLSIGQSFFAQVVLSDSMFFEILLRNHPLAKQANLLPSFGENTVLKAKGGFDPKAYHQTDQKYYNGSQYYSLMNSGLKLPTWYGIEVKTGFENNRGSYYNPQNKTPNGGLWYGGVAVNLGQGLFIDQRRAELFKAKIYQNSSVFEQKLQLNELVYEAGYSYWSWFLAHHSYEVLSEAMILAQTRLEAISRMAELGDRPAIDTVEAKIQVQSRESMLRQLEADLQKGRLKLDTYLWSESGDPLVLDSLTMPNPNTNLKLQSKSDFNSLLVDSVISNHPYLKIANFKIESLEVEKRLKKEMLKPQLNLQYNLLNEPINYNPFDAVSINNYKWGVSFEMPLFLRKERGDLELADLKVKDATFQMDNSLASINYKIQSSLVDLENSKEQLEIYQKTVLDTKALLDAERNMFNNGESSLFLINARETAYIQAKLKFIELLAKNQQAVIALKFALAKLV